MKHNKWFLIISLVTVFVIVLGACTTATPVPTTAPEAQQPVEAEPETVALPPAPAFDSACTPADEATVKPVDKQPGKPMKIAVLGLENNPFWIPVKEGTMKAAEELKPYGVTVDWIVPGDQHTAEVFGQAIEAAIAQEYDAIATIAGDSGVAPFIDKAVDKGIPVATFNSETATLNKRLFFVGADLYKQGEAACEAMATAIGGKGKVGIITGFFAVEAHELRRLGFEEKCKAAYPEIEVVGSVENSDKGDVAYTQAQDFMNANPELAGIYVTAGGPFGAAAAVKDAGKTGVVQVVSFDFVDETMEYVQEGVIAATIGQDPFAQGHDPAIRLYNYLVGGVAPECGRLLTRADAVSKDNIDQFWTPPVGMEQPKPVEKVITFPGDQWAAQCTPEDEGTVKPVDQQPTKPLKIAVLGLENNPFWIPVKEGTMKAGEELKAYNTTVDWIVPGDQHTAEVFGQAIEAAIAQEYDAIATIAGDSGVAPFIDKAVARGIPVATFNSETATENGRLFFVGADLYKQGEAACEAMATAIGGKGKVGIITGFFAVEAHELRRKGFEEKCKAAYPDIEVVGSVENSDKADVAYTQAQDFMNANPELAGIYVTAGGPFGAAAAVKDAGKAGKVWVVSFDFVDETMLAVQDGVIYATIGQDPFAQGHDPAIRLYNWLVGGVMPDCGALITRADAVTKENIDQFWTAP
jgi:ABC-type sugar transport system substrate-binding protein